jgi:hypothetical protein
MLSRSGTTTVDSHDFAAAAGLAAVAWPRKV